MLPFVAVAVVMLIFGAAALGLFGVIVLAPYQHDDNHQDKQQHNPHHDPQSVVPLSCRFVSRELMARLDIEAAHSCQRSRGISLVTIANCGRIIAV